MIMFGVFLTSNGLYLGAKAVVAQMLLDHAWATTLDTGQPTSPWAWMDTVPVAKISIPDTKNSAIVLNTMSGQALAFGPAHDPSTPLPGDPGISVIAAHKNTHFAFLKSLRNGDRISIQRSDGQTYDFTMTHADIVHKDHSGIPSRQRREKTAKIALVTCYPFDAVSFGGPMRYVVYGDLEESTLEAI